MSSIFKHLFLANFIVFFMFGYHFFYEKVLWKLDADASCTVYLLKHVGVCALNSPNNGHIDIAFLLDFGDNASK